MVKKRPLTKPVFTGTIFSKIVKKIAARIGVKVIIEPQWKVVGRIEYPSGRKRYFRYNSLDLNPLGSTEIAKDKDFADYFMSQLGYPTIPGQAFFSPEWEKMLGVHQGTREALTYARETGFPLIVKPNSQSQGREVSKVHTAHELKEALQRVFKLDKVALVQKVVFGKDYRIVVLDSEVISAYERTPLSIVGDGKSSILDLIHEKQKAFVKGGRDTVLNIDARIRNKLRSQGLTLRSVIEKNSRIFLLDNANLSQGGDAKDVTHVLHPSIQEKAIQLTKDMGLRLCGVDVLYDGDIAKPLQECTGWHVIEVNAAPGLDHYAASGAAQKRIVEDLYTKVLRRMEHAV